MSYLSSLVLSLLFAGVAFCECPVDWMQSGDKCYYFSNVDDDNAKLAWHEAQSQCESMRASLVVIETEAENNFLITQEKGRSWIGLHDLNAENEWQWVDGSSPQFLFWGSGQPDNWQGAVGSQEDCVEMNEDQGGAWNDFSCSSRINYICERSADIEDYPKCQEDDGWEEFESRCYKVMSTKRAWLSADADCKAIGANLVAITSDNEQLYVANEVNEWNANMWIGLSSVNNAKNELQWSNGVDTYPGYSNWGAGQPAEDPSASNCVQIDPSVATNGPWAVQRCGESLNYMCETAATGSCAPGWYLYKGKCYFQASTEQLWTTWPGAKEYCETMGAQLLKIDNYDEQVYVNSRLPDVADGGSIDMWIGISDSVSDGTFVWTDGTSAIQADFTYWQGNQPKDNTGAWDCGQIYTGSSWGGWEVDQCFKFQAFMCEIEAGKDVKPSTPVISGNQGCNPGWQFYQNNCYYFEHVKELTWQLAEQECVGYGGHLVSMLDGNENAFVTGHMDGTTWIGAHDIGGEGKFEWVDGSPWSFANWAEGEPNNNGGDGDCAAIWKESGYLWDDQSCGNKRNYVCKMQSYDCDQTLGMEDRRITDDQITATSMWNEAHDPKYGRLNNQKSADSIGAWVPEKKPIACNTVDNSSRIPCGSESMSQPVCESNGCCYDNSIPSGLKCFNIVYQFLPGGTEYIQVHLVPERQVSGITTQGRPSDYNQFVTKYKISYSNNNGNSYTMINKEFTANSDTFTPITNRLPSPVVAQYIRLYPWQWNQSPALRMELLGCNPDGSDLATPTPDVDCTSVPANERLDCGYPGIGGENCLSKGCCWDNTIPNTKWCFYRRGDYDTRCGKDWSFDPGGEYLCYHFNDLKTRTWSQARDYCSALGAGLLSINSEREQTYVSSQLSSYVSQNALWIGANNLDSSTGWQWSNVQPFNYFNWNTGEPNGYDNDEDCVEIYTSTGKWNDLRCSNEKGIACKKLADIVPPTITDDGNIQLNICEGETGTLVCTGSTVIAVHHAAYGRSNDVTCGEGNLVPEGGCQAVNSLDVVSQLCNNLDVCTIEATNDIFGDPCVEIYKYLNVIYSCENVACYNQLGVENGTVSDSQISASSSMDANHQATDGRLNGDRGWVTSEGVGAWIQVKFFNKIRLSGVILQGADDVGSYVTSFKVGFANDETFVDWTDYTDYDGNVVKFVGNSDTTSTKRNVFSEHVFSAGIRIYPLEWSGDNIGMRFELTGCNPLRELGCDEVGDVLWLTDADEGTIVQADCPGYCPFLVPKVTVYGTGTYAGNSQICNAAVHAGVILDSIGGPVTMIKKPDQSTYAGSVKNTIVSQDYNYYPLAFAFTNNEKNCEAGWIPYESYCYWISDVSLTWSESEDNCMNKGGHLVSVFDQVEQDFLLQQLYKSDFTDIWIGLNDLRSTSTYQWTDGTVVTYTNWKSREPNNFEGKNENCVEMYRDTIDYKVAGMWNDAICSDVEGFVCKKLKSYYTAGEAANPTPAPGCKDGWLPYDYTCYWFERTMMTESGAEDFCEQQGGTTVHIQSKYIQSFIHTVIGAEDKRWWIGLHALVTTDTGVSWVWESGDPVTYDNWGPGNPIIDTGECVVFYGGPYGYGLWYSYRCDQSAYVICELPRDGFTPPPPTTPPPVDGCQWDWTTPGPESNYCYKVIAPAASNENDQKQSWNNAYHQCTSYNADLVSVHSQSEETFLIGELSKLNLNADYAWIGLNNKGGSWSWSDGSAVQYLNWNVGYPDAATESNCVAMKYNVDTSTALWENLDCQQQFDWICKLPKGIEVVTPTDPPVGVPDSSCGDASLGTWIKFDSMCYLFNDRDETDFHGAEDICQGSGGQVVSIHTSREQSFIFNQLQSMNVSRYWIGLKEAGGVNGVYSWSDGTPVDFVNWNPGEPNDANGMEQCVVMYKSNGKWNDANCGLKYASFICKKFPGSPPQPPAPTSPWPGACPAGWLVYNNYCFQIHGEATVCDPAVINDTSCTADWRSAQLECNKVGGNLATIHNKYENAFLAAHTLMTFNNMWIGLSSITWGGKPFHWASGDELTYTNWNDGEPNAVNGEEDCVEMYRTEVIAGRWNDNRCTNSIPYACSKGKDASLSDGQQINNNAKCPDGWMQFDTNNDNYICFYMDTTPRTFADAQANCQSMGGNLASLQTMWDQAFVTSYVQDNLVWLGMQLNQDTGEWVWIDGWPVWISNWGEAQPGSDYTKNCVLNKDSVLGSEWVTASCTEQHMSLCKTSTENVPPTPGYVEGYCQDPSWETYGGYCYYYFLTEGDAENIGVSWNDAESMCAKDNGHLVSFTSRSEIEWMLSWYNNTESLWIGLVNNGQGGWSWTDYRPVSFTYWANGEPNNAGEEMEDCVEMYSDGKWNDLSCLTNRGYMCRIPKVIGTDDNGNIIHYTTPAPPKENPVGNNNAAIIAGSVIGALVLIAIVIGIAIYCSKTNDSTISKLTTNASDISSGFVNKLYSLAGNVTTDEKKSPDDGGFNNVTFEKEAGVSVSDVGGSSLA